MPSFFQVRNWSVAILLALPLVVWAQSPTAEPQLAGPQPAATQSTASAPAQPAAGGHLHGVVKSGSIPLPGVTVTAQNTLTGKRYSTTTDAMGAWSMSIPQNGRYVLRTQFAAFAPGAQEAVLNAALHDQAVNFDLMLASRAVAQQAAEQKQQDQATNAIRQLAGVGLQNLSLASTLGSDIAAGGSSGQSGAALPSIANSSDFSGESVAITGQSGQVSPLAGVDMDRLRDAMETARTQMGNQAGGQGGGLFIMGPGGGFGMPGGFGGGFGGPGGPGGGRMMFRSFNPSQPHGAVFWNGNNSALNAEPFSLRGQPQKQPASGANRFGVTLMGQPYIPGLTKPSGKDTAFINFSGSRNSSPVDQYATVPTAAQRSGDFSGLPAVYDPAADKNCAKYGATPGQPFSGNVIPAGCIAPQAAALLNGSSNMPIALPLPNLPGSTQNYHLLTTRQSNSTQGSVRYMRSIGANATPFGFGGRGNRSRTTQGLRQSVNANYNWSHNAGDNLNIIPMLGGKTSSDSNSLQGGYTLGYKKITSIFNAAWNRSNSQVTNYFTNRTDVATEVGILGPGGGPLNASGTNYGLPSIVLSSFTGITQQQPSFVLNQTISASETLSWIQGRHNLRFGGDYRRVHHDFLGGSNATGTFYFTGLYSQSSLADFLLGAPQETAIDSAEHKSYLRQSVFDLYAMDDWRARSNLTLNYGLRYEFFEPYTEKFNRLSMVDTNPSGGFTSVSQVQAGASRSNFGGSLPASLVRPFHLAIAPRFGAALRLPKQTVLRAGYGMNFTVGQYSTFATAMAHQPPFANEQTNICSGAATLCYSLANGFPSPDAIGNYAVDPHYELPYVQTWNVDIQKSLRWGIVANLGYDGSRGSSLDVKIAPRAVAGSPSTNPAGIPFFFEESGAFSRYNALTFRMNKRMSGGLALGSFYTYSHSIDDAGSVGGTGSVVAQNWTDIAADEGNSAFDQRHKLTGYYAYELPFGKDKTWFTAGPAAHALEGFSVSGSFTFSSGTPLTPTYQASVADVAHGTTGTQRPDRVAGASLTNGGGSIRHWFNTAAFTAPTPDAFGNAFGNAGRNSIPGPGTVQNNMSLAKTLSLGETRSMELRASANNVFNTVQYTGVNTTLVTSKDASYANTFGQVTSVGGMRAFDFMARFRF